ncbi:gene transfer agent family protein [Ostreiculturibacter nitratireducens]|uniref:gene transfer agent family protein n=1 Tax=Ostreiculturibacter nitratireducens TaxID=3075226 RepID=UPI0031B610C1
MANPWTGEVAVWLDGRRHVAKLTLGALAELEAALDAGTLIELVERFEARRFSTRDVLALLVAGLRGGGWDGTAADLRTVEIGGGPVEAARVAAELLARAFALPPERRG